MSIAAVRHGVSAILVLALIIPSFSQMAPEKSAGSARLYGYSTASSATEHGWEKKFQDGVQAKNVGEAMEKMSLHPHHVGSVYDKGNADWLKAQMKEFGFDAQIETFQVLFPTPKERIV